MAQLTPTEITSIITEVGLELCSATITDQAKLCIVYEEAHSLIPEWNAVASEGDKAATNGTAKAILQGRKYGLGCLVVTQRTANVTKTILNQCNTVFALRVFDSTGKAPARLGSSGLSLLGCPRKMGQEKGEKFMSYLYVRWNSFGLRLARQRLRH